MRMKSLFAMTALAVGLGLGIQTNVHAEFGDFDYATLVSASTAPPAPTPTATSTSITENSVTVTLTGNAATGLNAASPGTQIVFGGISVNAAALAAGTSASISIAYDFRVAITDHSPGSTGADTAYADILGTVSGTVSKNAGGAISYNLNTNSFNPSFYLVPSTGPFTSGAQYQIMPNAYTPPGADPGTFGAHVLAATTTPEPSSMALIGLGGLGAIFALRRRARA